MPYYIASSGIDPKKNLAQVALYMIKRFFARFFCSFSNVYIILLIC